MSKDELLKILKEAPGFSEFISKDSNYFCFYLGPAKYKVMRKDNENIGIKWEHFKVITDKEDEEISDIVSLLAEASSY